ncbi:hypothetical protein AB6H17_07285 [Proteus vulgaris]|uniref:hypothetical protein n=1 Tax=Proteus vulgaris TaxID=585 RepID=UPI0034DD521E
MNHNENANRTLEDSEGRASLFGQEDLILKISKLVHHVAMYATSLFALSCELTVRQNLGLHAKLFHIPEKEVAREWKEIGSDLI